MANPHCPQCQTALKDDYGMITCPGCGAIVFVDMDGGANVAGDSPASPAASDGDAPVAAESPSDFSPLGFDLPGSPESSSTEVGASGPVASSEVANPSEIDPNDPLGLSAYANSEISGAKDGPMVVTLVISGIDTKDIRDEIRQVLKDSRFGWDVVQVMSRIRGGELRIEAISPVKATVVINRIKSLPVQIRWEQNAITDLDIHKPDAGTAPGT